MSSLTNNSLETLISLLVCLREAVLGQYFSLFTPRFCFMLLGRNICQPCMVTLMIPSCMNRFALPRMLLTIHAMEDCICDIGPWMIHHQLMLNDGKTEFLIVGSRKQRTKVNIDHIHEGTSEIKPADSVRNLGTWFDSMMSMAAHVGKVCSKAFFGLYKIRQIRKFLSEDSTKILIHVFVASHIDYCNSLPFGIPQYQIDRLQNVLNAAARLVCHIPRYGHITPTFGSLH